MRKNNDEDDDSSQGSGIQFHDFIGSGKPQRDDLSPIDIKQLLAQHDSAHRHHVEKQLEKQKNREALKNGRMSLHEYRHGAGQTSEFKAHPALNSPQFSGIDQTENPLPSLNEANTNEEEKNENKLRNRPAPGAQPRFVPPRLTR